MKLKHLMIEGFCEEDKCNASSCSGTFKFGIHCFECSQFSYTYSPNEVAISDEDGVIEHWIGFGGSMEPLEVEEREEYITLWKEICKQKISEAHNEFFKQVKKKV